MSWITSLIALLIGLAPVWANLRELIFGGRTLATVGQDLNQYYNPLAGNSDALRKGYGALVGGLAFKIATAELARRAKMTSVVPALHA